MKDRSRKDLCDLMVIPGLSVHEERVAAAIRSRVGLRRRWTGWGM